MNNAEVAAFMVKRLRAQHVGMARCWGISADALVLYALGAAQRPQTPGWAIRGGVHFVERGLDYPHDRDDLLACERVYDMAPLEMKHRMLPVLEDFRAWVNLGLNRHGVGHPWMRPEPPEPQKSLWQRLNAWRRQWIVIE